MYKQIRRILKKKYLKKEYWKQLIIAFLSFIWDFNSFTYLNWWHYFWQFFFPRKNRQNAISFWQSLWGVQQQNFKSFYTIFRIIQPRKVISNIMFPYNIICQKGNLLQVTCSQRYLIKRFAWAVVLHLRNNNTVVEESPPSMTIWQLHIQFYWRRIEETVKRKLRWSNQNWRYLLFNYSTVLPILMHLMKRNKDKCINLK